MFYQLHFQTLGQLYLPLFLPDVAVLFSMSIPAQEWLSIANCIAQKWPVVLSNILPKVALPLAC